MSELTAKPDSTDGERKKTSWKKKYIKILFSLQFKI
jgi:hypothetical protein